MSKSKSTSSFPKREQRISKAMGLAEFAYLAGLIDGEGTIFVIRRPPRLENPLGTYHLRLQIVNTDWRLILWLQDNFGAKVATLCKGTSKWKRSWSAMWYTGYAKEVIKLIQPYLIIKKEQASIALEFPTDKERMPEKRRELYMELKVLNRKGPK